MSDSRDATYTPDGGRASDATTAASTKEAAARGLVRTEAVREACRRALVRASEPADDRDTGAHAPAAAARGASTTSRLRRLLRRRDRRADTAPDDATPHGESSDEASDAPDATSAAEGAPNPMGANADGGASGSFRTADGKTVIVSGGVVTRIS